MEPRVDYPKASPEAFRAMLGLETFVRKSGLERPLVELVKLRASQINGCAAGFHSLDHVPQTAGDAHKADRDRSPRSPRAYGSVTQMRR